MLWRFHRVHHSARQLDWLAPSRRHPVDAVIARASTALPVLVLGFAVPTVATHFALKRLQGLFVHCEHKASLRSVRARRGHAVLPPLAPQRRPGTWNTNYAGSLPVVDWIFGTMQLPGGGRRSTDATATSPTSATSHGSCRRGRDRSRVSSGRPARRCRQATGGKAWSLLIAPSSSMSSRHTIPLTSNEPRPPGSPMIAMCAATNVAQQRSHQLAVGAEHGVG